MVPPHRTRCRIASRRTLPLGKLDADLLDGVSCEAPHIIAGQRLALLVKILAQPVSRKGTHDQRCLIAMAPDRAVESLDVVQWSRRPVRRDHPMEVSVEIVVDDPVHKPGMEALG